MTNSHPFGNQAATSLNWAIVVHGFASRPRDRFALLEDEEAVQASHVSTGNTCQIHEQRILLPGIRPMFDGYLRFDVHEGHLDGLRTRFARLY